MKLTKIALACVIATGTLAPQFASADDAFEFHGYARAGFTYEADGKQSIGPSGYDGAAIGRLGNESNGGEVVLLKKFEGDNDTNWEVGFMMEDWGKDGGNYNNLGTKQMWAGGTNIFASQPNAYVWAGKVFHARVQSGLNDYFITINDGAGTGVKGLEIGGAKLELGVVTNDQTNYLITSRVSDISLGETASLDLIANYGFANDTVDGVNAYQLLAIAKAWGHNFYYRYADNVGNSLSWGKQEGLSSHFFSFEGSQSLSDSWGLEYLAAYHAVDYTEANGNADYDAFTAILRSTHQWNNIHSTWLEFGYGSAVEDNTDADIDGYKVTFSQNMAVGGVTWARPQIRFFVTAGQDVDDESVVIAGAMFEAWW